MVGVLRDRAVRAAGDRDRGGAVVEGDPQRLYDVAGGAGVGDGDGDVAGAELYGVGDGEVRVAVGVRDQADAEQLLAEVLGDESGGADAVDVDAAGGGERGDGGAELDGVESGGGVGEGLLLVVGELGDDVGDGVVDGDVGGDGGRAAGLLLCGEAGEGEAQVAVAGVAEEPGGADDGRLAGAGELGEAGDREGGAAGRVMRRRLRRPAASSGSWRARGSAPWPRGRRARGRGRRLARETFLHFIGHI